MAEKLHGGSSVTLTCGDTTTDVATGWQSAITYEWYRLLYNAQGTLPSGGTPSVSDFLCSQGRSANLPGLLGPRGK